MVHAKNNFKKRNEEVKKLFFQREISASKTNP